MNKNTNMYLGLFLGLILIVILAPLTKQLLNQFKIIEGNTQASASTDGVSASTDSTSATASPAGASTSTETSQASLAKNLEYIEENKYIVQNLINDRNQLIDRPLDTETVNARLDYIKLDNKSINIQMILLSIIVIILAAILIQRMMSQ